MISVLLRLAVITAVVTMLAPWRSFTGLAAPEDFEIPNGHFYTQTGEGEGKGFGVVDDNGVHLESELERLGGPMAVGFPVSDRFRWHGFVSQGFQRGVMQWRPELGQVQFVNVFDLAHDAGMDDVLFVSRQVPKQEQFEEEGLPFEDVVKRRLALLDDNPAIKAMYFSVGDPVQRNGLPTSHVVDMGTHFALRSQRVEFQQWKQDMPWARAGQVTLALGGDIAKEVKLLPKDADVEPQTEQEFEVERQVEIEREQEFEREMERERQEDRQNDQQPDDKGGREPDQRADDKGGQQPGAPTDDKGGQQPGATTDDNGGQQPGTTTDDQGGKRSGR